MNYLSVSRQDILDALELHALENDLDQTWYDQKSQALDQWLDPEAPEWLYRRTKASYYLAGYPHPFAACREAEDFQNICTKINDWSTDQLGKARYDKDSRGRYDTLCEIAHWSSVGARYDEARYPTPAIEIAKEFFNSLRLSIELHQEYLEEAFEIVHRHNPQDYSDWDAHEIGDRYLSDPRTVGTNEYRQLTTSRDPEIRALIDGRDVDGIYAWGLRFYQKQHNVISEIEAILSK